MKFEMSGQRFELDEDPESFTADEMFALEDEVGISLDALDELGAAMQGGQVSSQALRAVVGLAWLAHRRQGGTLAWRPFCATVRPATLRVLDDEPTPVLGGGDGGPRKPSATRKRVKPR